jgi:serine protease
VSPRLPSGVLLAATVAMMAATAVTVVGPAAATTRAPAGPAAKSDKIRNTEWWLSSLHVTQAWASSRGSGITVALLSTGVLTTHPDLTGSVSTGPDYTGSGETSASDTWGIEGTSAASVIAAHGDSTGDAAGLIGIAPAARVLSIRVAFDAADPLTADSADVGRLPDAIAQGIRYAVAQGAKIIDLPLDPSTLASDGAASGGLPAAAGGSAAERSAVSYAQSKGVVLVAPAGDNGEDGNTAGFPASYPGVIALGAVDQHGALAGFSTRLPYVALTAPGVGVTAASRPAGYRTMSTTDAASAMVAGIAALIRSRYPALTASQVRQALITGSERSAASTQAGAGAGTVDALKAMQAAAAIASPQPTATPSKPAATTPAVVAPITARPKPSTVGMAKSALRDAAYAAGALIVLLLGVLLGFRLWRRRSSQDTQPATEQPRTLLDAPLGPSSGPQPIQASNARHARAGAEFAPLPAAASLPFGPRDTGRAPDTVSPRFAPSGAMAMEPDALDDGLGRPAEPAPPAAVPGEPAPGHGRARKGRAGRSSATRHTDRSEASEPGGPPWEPAPAPVEALPQAPWTRPPDPFNLATRPAEIAPAPWDTAGPSAPPPPGAELPRRESGGAESGGAEVGGAEASDPFAPGPPAGGRPPIAWRPVPAADAPRPGLPAAPGSFPGSAMGTPTPPTGLPAAPGALFTRPEMTGDTRPDGASRPDGAGRPGEAGQPDGAAPADWASSPRPISPRDRLPMTEPGALGPEAPVAPPPPAPSPWRLGRADEFLPPYAGRPAPADEPASGPARLEPPPSAEPADGRTEESPSGPMYLWNPASLTEPFPSSSTPSATPATPPDDEADPPDRG